MATDPHAEAWPPKDPTTYPTSDPNHKFTLPDTPWTYENGTLNPHLQPSNTLRRTASATRRRQQRAKREPLASVPPYHPDYKPPGDNDDDTDEWSDTPPSNGETSDEGDSLRPKRFIRRGSEGYEVRPINREASLRQHVYEQMHEPGRYNVYVPDPPSDAEEEVDEDDAPLSAKVESWRAATAV